MQPPTSWSTPSTAQAPQPRRPPPQPEFQCHHADCLRRFVRKTSLTNHLKAHQNIRSRSIYRTKRARLRAAAAMQAAADAAAATSTTNDPSSALQLPQQQSPDHLQQPQQQPHPAYRASAALHPDTSLVSRRTDSSPISTASGPSSPSHHVLSSHPVRPPPTASSVPLHDSAPTSLVSPNSFSTHPLDAQDNSALLFTKAFDMSAVPGPTWGIPPPDPYQHNILPFVPQRTDETPKPDTQGAPPLPPTPTEPLPIVSHIESVPNAASAATAAAAADLLPPQSDLFSEPIEPLHPYEFLGDFGSYN